MIENRAYTADEIIAAMADALCKVIGINPTNTVFDRGEFKTGRQTQIPKARAAYLVSKQMERVPTEGQMKAMRRIFCCGAPDIGECTRKNCERDTWDARVLAIQSTASDARIAEIEAGREEKS